MTTTSNTQPTHETAITTHPEVTIRCSALPMYPDCPRRSVASIMRRDLESLGYEFRERAPLISGCIGTGLHGAQKHALTEKAAAREPAVAQSIEAAMAAFVEDVADGAEYDETTLNGNHAYTQIQTMTRAFYSQVLPELIPRLDDAGQPVLEYYREGVIEAGFRLTGSLDCETVEDDIEDTKTGKSGDGYHAQLGAYSILKRANTGKPAAELFVEHVPRVSVKKPYPGTKQVVYKRELCEAAAFCTIRHIIRDIKNFRATQSPWAFQANINSQLCSPKYCIAYGTAWCELTAG